MCVGDPRVRVGGFQGFVEKERDMRFCKRQAGAGDVVQVVESLSSMQGAPHLILSITLTTSQVWCRSRLESSYFGGGDRRIKSPKSSLAT